MRYTVVSVDSEISKKDKKICDLGAYDSLGREFHSGNLKKFSEFVFDADFILGHNIINHDMKYIKGLFNQKKEQPIIDTLYLSPLLFPKKPYHKLLKDDKLQTDSLNNPLNDSKKALELFYDEVGAFMELPPALKRIYCALLFPFPEFQGFFKYNDFRPYSLDEKYIKLEFRDEICMNADISFLMEEYPIELAYSLAIISSDDKNSITPPWVLMNYPKVENVIQLLTNKRCESGCEYCDEKLNIKKQLKRFFGFDSFRTYSGEPLQEKAVNAAVCRKSLLAVFPTGGGKSLTFQLPALMAGENAHGLTVVISPLVSLMKDQVDNLAEKGIVDSVAINGLLSPIERSEAIERVKSGMASILYVSPEALRSKTIENIISSRIISRFVIDEAHCFSAWGQDFRVDYLYIGEFIRRIQDKKGISTIPVSCFTATAKQKVITDIRDYFKRELNLDLELYTTNETRKNLRYEVLFKETNYDKYNTLRNMIEEEKVPTIIYVSRVNTAKEIAERLNLDGFSARPYYGKLSSKEKITYQEEFINNKVQVIVATSAFGMGVDKKDVQLVIHYDISDSLENYVQESGRAGRDESINAKCYVLFNDDDLNKHFTLLNQSKVSISEIQQVWKAIKDLTHFKKYVNCSTLEIARQAGWDEVVKDYDMRVKTAISALETAGFISRGNNSARIYATSIYAKNMVEASKKIEESDLFNELEKQQARRIISKLISSKSKSKLDGDAEARVDYIADILGIEKEEVIHLIGLMRQLKLLEDNKDMSAFMDKNSSEKKCLELLENFAKLERYILSNVDEGGSSFNLKELNEMAQNENIGCSSVKNIKTIIYFWTIKGYIQKSEYNTQNRTDIIPTIKISKLIEKCDKRIDISDFIVRELYKKRELEKDVVEKDNLVLFSLLELFNKYNNDLRIDFNEEKIVLSDIEDSLLYLSKIKAITLDGGFLVYYNYMEINRVITDNKVRYKKENYQELNNFYKQKIQQIHIVGEYANLMVKNYHAALKFVNDYFQLDYKKFISSYFKGNRLDEIELNITPERYKKIFGDLSDIQSEIIKDLESKYIVVAAGPGSGKTKILVHKLASLLLMEDVKHEQLLMVTFSRAAATNFKKRLIELIGGAANYIEIKTFHSYCFDLVGRVGSLEQSDNIVKKAVEMINNEEVEIGRIAKTVLVIDEAQDMDNNEFELIKALINRNEEMRVIAVGDDDQNIYEFRGSNSKYMKALITDLEAKKYEMQFNYRSKIEIVKFANYFAETIYNRMKVLPGEAVSREKGIVKLIKHHTDNFEQAIVNQIEENRNLNSTCVLTTRNDEALIIAGLLNKRGFKAKIIQSIVGFNLYDLLEIRYFVDLIGEIEDNPLISKEVWDSAKEKLKDKFKNSSCLEICLKMLEDFEEVNEVKYRTDFIEYIKESNYDDFCGLEKDVIFVSTIHKAKGKEFDNVYMFLDNYNIDREDNKRAIYVGITRAKNELYIHYNNQMFVNPPIKINNDYHDYDEPNDIILQLTHKDVVLSYFNEKEKMILKLYSGYSLIIDGDYLLVDYRDSWIKIGKFSRAFSDKLYRLEEQGFEIIRVNIRFIVWWYSEDEEREIPIVLPEIELRKNI